MKAAMLLGVVLMMTLFASVRAFADDEPVYLRCVPAGSCDDNYEFLICPGTTQYPAGLCSYCTKGSENLEKCVGVVVIFCEQDSDPGGCGDLISGTCLEGSCANWVVQTGTHCGNLVTCGQ